MAYIYTFVSLCCIFIQVFNSRKLRSDALIGDFKLDVGTIYEEDDHSIGNKWLLLSNADDANAGAKGYLLVSMGVLGSGDDAPVSQVNFVMTYILHRPQPKYVALRLEVQWWPPYSPCICCFAECKWCVLNGHGEHGLGSIPYLRLCASLLNPALSTVQAKRNALTNWAI